MSLHSFKCTSASICLLPSSSVPALACGDDTILTPFSVAVPDEYTEAWQDPGLSADLFTAFSLQPPSAMDLQTIHDASHELMCALNLKRGINPTYEEIMLDDKNPVPYQPLPLSETLLRFLPHDSVLFHVVTTVSSENTFSTLEIFASYD